MRLWEVGSSLLVLLPLPLPNLANIRLTASCLGACGRNDASQALHYVLCLPTWYLTGELLSPGTSIPLELARWSRQREGDLGSAPRGICVWKWDWGWLLEIGADQTRQALRLLFVKSASNSRTHGQAMAGEHFRVHPLLLWRWLLAQPLRSWFWRRWGSLCCSPHLTFERLAAYWPEELGAD